MAETCQSFYYSAAAFAFLWTVTACALGLRSLATYSIRSTVRPLTAQLRFATPARIDGHVVSSYMLSNSYSLATTYIRSATRPSITAQSPVFCLLLLQHPPLSSLRFGAVDSPCNCLLLTMQLPYQVVGSARGFLLRPSWRLNIKTSLNMRSKTSNRLAAAFPPQLESTATSTQALCLQKSLTPNPPSRPGISLYSFTL